ncbi:MAG: hypothetical protein WA900_06855 [Casimicrobiaceae bacterium]
MDGRLAMRELRPADAAGLQAFVRRLSPESRRRRCFTPINELTPSQLARVTTGRGPDDLDLATSEAEGRIVARPAPSGYNPLLGSGARPIAPATCSGRGREPRNSAEQSGKAWL